MEKFTVDLDKVLDEFEFNEEQAVRHALQHFKREDLPASKYQKPHFRPINIAEADFGPCIETTMSYSPYHHKHSQDSTKKLIETDTTSLNCKKNNNIKHTVAADLIKPPSESNCHSETLDSYNYNCHDSGKVVRDQTSLKGDDISNINNTGIVFEDEQYKIRNKNNSINEKNLNENTTVKLDLVIKEQDVKTTELKQTEFLKNDEGDKCLKEENGNLIDNEMKKVDETKKRKEEEDEKKKNEEEERIRMEEKIKTMEEKIKRMEEEQRKQIEEQEKKFQEELQKRREEEKKIKIEDGKERKMEEKEEKKGEENDKKIVEEKEMNKSLEVEENQEEEKTKNMEREESEREENKIGVELPLDSSKKKMAVDEQQRTFVQDKRDINLNEDQKMGNIKQEKSQVAEVEDIQIKETETIKSNTDNEIKKENSDICLENVTSASKVKEDQKIFTKLPEISDITQVKSLKESASEVNVILNEPENTETEPECKANVIEGVNDTESEKTPVVKIPVEEVSFVKEEIKPIQFETQLDITDEELQRYLEELEEEEEEEQRKKETESKPVRPDSLNLNYKNNSGEYESSKLTPLARNSGGSEGVRLEEENLKNENKEGASAKTKANVNENMDPLEEVEGLIEASSFPTSSEPPLTIDERRLGKVSPFWMPDNLASNCMECDSKFTVIKRRHHCRACGRILCSKCCGMRASLEYLQNQEQKVCETCFRTLAKVMMYELQNESENESSPRRRPNPNNPMEYCSTVPPPLQVSSSSTQPPPSVLVPVGVLKREGSSKIKETPKQVMFSDGIRPGGDLTELDGSGDQRNTFRKPPRGTKRAGTPPGNSPSTSVILPPIDPISQSFIIEKSLPPVCIVNKGETTYEENWPLPKIMERLRDPELPPLHFAINRNLVASIKITKLDCCMEETCWVICSKGMGCVGQDEIIVLLTLNSEEDDQIPKEVFLQFHYIYQEASRGNTVNELGYWCVKESTFLDSKQHGGFLFIRPTFQCLNRIEVPPPPFLVGVLIHRSEIPWARVFPFRLMLRLGAEFRYYPCPLVSVRFREPVYYEIGHTIINLLADFRNLSYTIPSVRGLKIHMEANQTSILIPRNRYDQVIRALNNSNDPVLALAGNFSPEADAHLVCMQSKGNEITYTTHAININDKPRKVTGASFVVLNGALKSVSGVAAKSSIVEDGLMVQVPSETMTALRTKLRNMEDWSVRCGPIEGRNSEEVVKIIWCEDDKNFNIGVKSVIDHMPLDGVPSIRVHSGKDYMGCTKFIRWTQVFIIKCEDGATSAKIGDPLEVNKLSENIARATCLALTKLLELLAASGLSVLAVRATIDQDNVGYEAGSNGEKLAPIYMNSLDNELIPVLHKAASVNDSVAVLELIFHIMDQ